MRRKMRAAPGHQKQGQIKVEGVAQRCLCGNDQFARKGYVDAIYTCTGCGKRYAANR